jgi:hypothetical protein
MPWSVIGRDARDHDLDLGTAVAGALHRRDRRQLLGEALGQPARRQPAHAVVGRTVEDRRPRRVGLQLGPEHQDAQVGGPQRRQPVAPRREARGDVGMRRGVPEQLRVGLGEAGGQDGRRSRCRSRRRLAARARRRVAPRQQQQDRRRQQRGDQQRREQRRPEAA